MLKPIDVAIIGGGAAGLIAAGKAAEKGLSVLLLEKMEKTARKLRITGKGRCNITTTKPFEEIIEAFKPNGNFLRNALNEFGAQSIIQLLNEQNVPTIEERGNRVFPLSGRAWDVADALTKWCIKQGVTIVCNTEVKEIITENNRVCGLRVINKKNQTDQIFPCQTVILATGGKTYPATGSTGDGYALAAQLGHTITPLHPVLVGFDTNPRVEVATALTLKNVSITLLANNKTIDEQFGDIDIMPFGLSGPVVLKISRDAALLMEKGRLCSINLDFKPALTIEKLVARIEREIAQPGRLNCLELVRKLLPKEITHFIIEQSGIAAQKVANRLSDSEIITLANTLKECHFQLISSRGWNEAIITMGGVSLREVNPKSMESLIIKGLYFAGEVLDLDGPTGGYNLQIAFSTGWLAGKSAATELGST